MGLFDKLGGNVKHAGMGQITGWLLKKAALGKFPICAKQAAWVYWHFKGIKSALGICLGLATGLVMLLDSYGICDLAVAHWAWFNCDTWASAITRSTGSLSAFFLYLGQVDGSLDLEGPDLTLAEVMQNFRIKEDIKRFTQ